MAVKMKPIKSTEIKDPKIVRDIISEIQRKPTAEDKKWAKERHKLFIELTSK